MAYIDNSFNSDKIKETVLKYITKPQGEYTIEDLESLPDDVYVELIDGVIYDMSGASYEHQLLAFNIAYQLESYVRMNKGECSVSVVCDKDKLTKKRVEGAPDLVIEVLSPSTKKKDHTIKLNKYLEAGVREYWLIDPVNKKVIVYLLEEGLNTFLYTFEDKIPVAIWNNEYYINMQEIQRKLTTLFEESPR